MAKRIVKFAKDIIKIMLFPFMFCIGVVFIIVVLLTFIVMILGGWISIEEVFNSLTLKEIKWQKE